MRRELFYTVIARDAGEFSFTAESVQQLYVRDSGSTGAILSDAGADMDWGDGMVQPGRDVSFGGGFPVQP